MKNAINEKMRIGSLKYITKGRKMEKFPDSTYVFIPMEQHIGQSAKEKVKIGDYVKQYEKIGEIQGNISSNIHSSVSGFVEDISENSLANGKLVKTIKIKNDFEYNQIELETVNIFNINKLSKEQILEKIKEAGLVGEGGAQFPTYVKYNIGDKKVDTLILNGAECEPYLTSDYTIMKEFTEEIFNGIKILNQLLEPREVVIGIESANGELENVFLAIIKKEKLENVKIKVLPTAYPQGSELQLIKAVTGKELKKGDIPINSGVIVSNISTVKSVYFAVSEGKPLIERVVTISGEKVNKIGNYLIKIGTPLKHITDKLSPANDSKIVFGGPMMGTEVEFIEKNKTIPVIKGTSGILFLSSDIDDVERKNCISCGACVEVCPMGLMPLNFAKYYENKKLKKLVKINIDNCIECGACEYVCPSRVPLIYSIKNGKMQINELRKEGGLK